MGRQGEATAEVEQALRLDPLNPFFQALAGVVLMSQRRFDDAIAKFHVAMKTPPPNPVVLWNLWECYYSKGMYDEAAATAKYLFAIPPEDRELIEVLAHHYPKDGYRATVKLLADALSHTTYINPGDVAALYAMAGEKDLTIVWLEKAYTVHDLNMVYLNMTPALGDLLGNDPRFKDLLRRMHLPSH